MRISAEISYYPLHEEFIPPIKDFIDRLLRHDELEVRPNTMSTQVFGEFADVMDAIREELEKSAALPHSVFVMKIVNADLR